MKKFFKRNLSILFSILVLVTSIILMITIAKEIVEIFLYIVLISISSIHILLFIFVPTLYPKKIDPETVFLGGATKPPYVNLKEVYSPYVYFSLKKIKRVEKEGMNEVALILFITLFYSI